MSLEKLEPRSKGRTLSEAKISKGRETLRLRAKGPATVEEMVWWGVPLSSLITQPLIYFSPRLISRKEKLHVTKLVGLKRTTEFDD